MCVHLPRQIIRQVALAVVVLAGCATTDKIPPEQYTALTQQVAQRGAGVVTDGCVARDEVGSDYLLRAPSAQHGEQARDALTAYLRSRGYAPARSVTPFFCGTLQDEARASMSIAEDKGQDKTAIGSLPLVLDAQVGADASLAAAYRRLLIAVKNAPVTGSSDSSAPAFDMQVRELSALQQHLGGRYAWIASYEGLEVSAGKGIGMGLLTGIATVALFGVGTAAMPVSNFEYAAALVDLEGREIVWKHVLQGPPLNQKLANAKAKPYGPEWSALVLDPVIPADGQDAR